MINEAAERRWFAGEDPIGKRVTVGSATPEVVGVVADMLHRDPGQPAEPELFRPYAQRTSRSVRMVVRAVGDPLAMAPAIRAEVRALCIRRRHKRPDRKLREGHQVMSGSAGRKAASVSRGSIMTVLVSNTPRSRWRTGGVIATRPALR